jgi:hypothetical protein
LDIRMENFVAGDTTSLVGKQNGRRFKEALVQRLGELTSLERAEQKLKFIFSNSIITINGSFFLAVFADRIRELGVDAFNQKYEFEASDYIQAKIQNHVRNALNAASMEDILDV